MKTAYEYNASSGIVTICAFHPLKSLLETRARKEHPDALVSHGICEVCLERVCREATEPRQAWLEPNPAKVLFP